MHEHHERAIAAVAGRPAAGIRVVAPQIPFVHDGGTYKLNADVLAKYELAKAAMQAAGLTVVLHEWERKRFEYLGGDENVMVELLSMARPINGHPLREGARSFLETSLGQMATFISEYLAAPVSPLEVLADASRAGGSHAPAASFTRASFGTDETQLRYLLGPFVPEAVATYNSIFDHAAADVLIMPSAACATAGP
jgi:hypothetical protein